MPVKKKTPAAPVQEGSTERAHKAVAAASEKQAEDIILLDLRKLVTYTDYFVLCTGETARQINAITSSIDEALTKNGARLLHREGASESGWVLLDFGDVVAHVFAPEQRAYYRLDRIWQKAPVILRMQ